MLYSYKYLDVSNSYIEVSRFYVDMSYSYMLCHILKIYVLF